MVLGSVLVVLLQDGISEFNEYQYIINLILFQYFITSTSLSQTYRSASVNLRENGASVSMKSTMAEPFS